MDSSRRFPRSFRQQHRRPAERRHEEEEGPLGTLFYSSADAASAHVVGSVTVSSGSQSNAARPLSPLDTTAAGDTFVGGFAAALAQGKPEDEAIAFGQRAAALSVTRAGAQPSIPHLNELQGLAP